MALSKQDRPVKAYVVTEDTEGTGGIVYAKTNAQARREGSCQFGSGDFDWGLARRAPEFDTFAPHGPSSSVLFEHGWWMECEECARHARADSGGLDLDGVFYCSEHADFYAWREPSERTYWRHDDFVWAMPRFWYPTLTRQAKKED